MWNTSDIDDLQILPPDTTREVSDGYAINIRPHLMSGDLTPFVVTPTSPVRRWADDMGKVSFPLAPADPERPGKLDFSRVSKPVYSAIFLLFPDLETAKATSLGQYWQAS